MNRTREAVYEHGVLRPLAPVDLEEGQRVRFRLADEDPIELTGRVYDGLSEEDIAEVESIALDRSGWHRA